jgi:HAD superfamily hydrolase (TIGR01509 family)
MIRAVVFDFNGILADDDPIHMEALLRVAREEGLSFTRNEYKEKYLALQDSDCFREIWRAGNRTLDERKSADLIQRKGVYYFEAIRGRDVLFQGAREAVQAARLRGPVAIASGARETEIHHILAGAGLLSPFATIVAAEHVQKGKPNPEPFQVAWQRLRDVVRDLKVEECLAVEDSIGGLESARAAGLHCLGVTHSYPRERLEGKAHAVIDSIAEFPVWLEQQQ